jgi:hypothetical protein
VASGYSLLFDAKQIGQGEKVFQDPWTPERDPSRSPSLLLVGLKGKEKRERRD